MASFQRQILAGREALLAEQNAWNDLWQRSYARQATVRAEGIAVWLKYFGEGRDFLAVCLREGERLVAALPLVVDRKFGVQRVYKLTVNCWSNSGDLLIARDVDLHAAVALLIESLQELPAGLFSFDEITLGAPHWSEFRQALPSHGGQSYVAAQSPVGVIDIRGQWDEYEKSWSGNHRGAVKRSLRKLEKQGELRLERHRSDDEELERLIRLAFEIENRSWKGNAGTSVLQTPGTIDFMVEEARAVARAGLIDVWFLYFNDQPIAFEYCHYVKGTCFSHKIGYDPEFSKSGPGRLLRYLQLQEYHNEPDCKLFDMLGTLCGSKAKWATRTYDTGRLLASVGHASTNALVNSYAWASPLVRSVRGTTQAESPKLGATGYLGAVLAEGCEPSLV